MAGGSGAVGIGRAFTHHACQAAKWRMGRAMTASCHQGRAPLPQCILARAALPGEGPRIMSSIDPSVSALSVWLALESPTHHTPGVNGMMDLVAKDRKSVV